MPTFVIQSHRGVEQLVARRAHNPEAGGSSPSPATDTDIDYSMSVFYSFPSATPKGLREKGAQGERYPILRRNLPLVETLILCAFKRGGVRSKGDCKKWSPLPAPLNRSPYKAL